MHLFIDGKQCSVDKILTGEQAMRAQVYKGHSVVYVNGYTSAHTLSNDLLVRPCKFRTSGHDYEITEPLLHR